MFVARTGLSCQQKECVETMCADDIDNDRDETKKNYFAGKARKKPLEQNGAKSSNNMAQEATS